ncbi:MlaD family protein [Paraconexibacter antarcticus]|uniref:MlaD family protein n=1 Tax=Paraconexibacter antarcticus TaxID=2949664 RepID=A0ABY5DV74_9ACTN|nr:MlaD family protein [Paraconexibacter antarcticus]UTI65916.1 MlaD family protein [Paraconexibacter antarcticus]
MAAKRRTPRKRLSVGTLGLVGIVAIALVVYFSFAKRVPFVHGYRADAVLSNTSQLRKGSPIRVAGVDVGKVVGLAKGPGTTALVKMEFKDNALPIHQDATIRVRPRLFLEGGFYIELRPGSPSAPDLPDGGTIPLPQTQVPVQFDQILTSLNHSTRDSIKRTITNLSEGLDNGAAHAFGNAAKPFTPALRDTAIVAQAARGIERHDLSNLISSLSMITGTLAANDRALGGMVGALDTTSGALASQSANLGATVRGIDDLVRTAPPSLTAIDAALPSVKRFADALRPNLPQTPATLRHTAALLRQAGALAKPAELPALLTKLTPTIDRLPTLSRRLTTLFPLVTPVSNCLQNRVLPVLNASLNDGANSTGRPVWQDLLHATTGLASSSQDFDANGPAVRYIAAAGAESIATGSLPGLPQLVGQGPKIEGTSPHWLGNGNLPPYHPEATCTDQAAPNLQARTPFPAAGTITATKRSSSSGGGTPAAATVPTITRTVGEQAPTASAPSSALRDALRDVARQAAKAATVKGAKR